MNKLFVITDLPKQSINGHTYALRTLKKAIQATNVEPSGVNERGADLYDIDAVAAAMLTYSKMKKDGTSQPELLELRLLKLKEDISKSKLEQERLIQDKQKAELINAELKRRLIDGDEVKQFLMTRMALQTQLLRRLLLTNMPTEVSGIDIRAARKVGETYYNLLMDMEHETNFIFQQRCLADDKPVEVPKRCQEIINKLFADVLPEDTKVIQS